MADELEKTCENCKYEYEDIEDTHCRHCIHNAEEHFEPKEVELSKQEIRAKAIDEFVKSLYKIGEHREFDWEDIYKLADQMKVGVDNGNK